MNTIDITLSAILIFGLVRGFIKGFFLEITALLALALGLYGAIHFSHFAANFLRDFFSWSDKYIQIGSFAITFFIIVLLISLSGKLLTKIADSAALGFMNKIFGAVFGLAKIGLILSVVLIVFDKMNSTLTFVKDDNLNGSQLYSPVKNFAPLLFPSILKLESDGLDEEG